MKLVGRTSSRFKEWLHTTDGVMFLGRIEPLNDSSALSTNFLDARDVLHVLPDEVVGVGDCIVAPTGKVFLLAQHDVVQGVRITYKLFPMIKQVSWTRTVTDFDPITQLPRATGDGPDMGPIWILPELYGREDLDRGLYVQSERRRLVTGAAVQLNDKVDGWQVRRVNVVYGVNVVETQ